VLHDITAMHTAEVVSIGDELTSGQRLDTNSQWLSTRLGELGIRVLYHTTVADDLVANCRVFRQAIERADVVVATGGLGPTADDLTRDALAAAAGVELAQDDKSLRHIRALFRRRGREMPERNVVQALFPRGSRPIANPHGTAPGIDMVIDRDLLPTRPTAEHRTSSIQHRTSNEEENLTGSTLDVGCSMLDVRLRAHETSPPKGNTCHVFCLPGVPAEMKEMWPAVAAALTERGLAGRVIRHRVVRCFGVGESDLERMLPDLIRRGREPQVGITASGATLTLRITAAGATPEECHAAMGPTLEIIQQCLGPLVFGDEEEELQHAVLRLLAQRGRTLGLVEWGSGGQIAWWLRELPGGEKNVPVGLVIGHPRAAEQLLGVSGQAFASQAGRTVEAAESLAAAARERFATDYALAVGPYPSDLGTASGDDDRFHIALATPEGIVTQSPRFVGHPDIVNVLAAKRALDLLRLTLLKS
jgi:nicotinamide-nucleotide amidase